MHNLTHFFLLQTKRMWERLCSLCASLEKSETLWIIQWTAEDIKILLSKSYLIYYLISLRDYSIIFLIFFSLSLFFPLFYSQSIVFCPESLNCFTSHFAVAVCVGDASGQPNTKHTLFSLTVNLAVLIHFKKEEKSRLTVVISSSFIHSI